jgi:DNA-binding GntR family transcriptional regulator
MRDEARPGNAADGAYLTLRADILDGTLPEGERLTEVTLAERLGLSRTPVREAVKRLILEGFLTRLPGEGLRVTGLSPDEVDQIFRMRALLESHGARRAALQATPAQAQELHRLAQVMTDHTPPADEAAMEVLSAANAQFHRTIVQAARSPRLAAMLSLAVTLGLSLRTYRLYDRHDMIRQARHHHDIAEAISARDADWAEAAMRTHVLAAAAAARRRMGNIAHPTGS